MRQKMPNMLWEGGNLGVAFLWRNGEIWGWQSGCFIVSRARLDPDVPAWYSILCGT